MLPEFDIFSFHILCLKIAETSSKNTQTSWVWKRAKGENMFWLIALLEYKQF